MADGTVTIDTSLNNKGFEKGIGKLGSIAKAGLKVLAAGTVATGAAFAGVVKQSVQARGEIEQQMGGTEAVFGKHAKKAQDLAVKAYDKMGASANDYMATINKMGSLMQGSGISQKKSLELSSQAMQRAADVASIMGLDINSAMESIAGAAKGNFTMMDNLGVAMNATTIETYALSKGIKTAYKDMDNSQKIQLAMEMFLEKSAYAAGNYAKENDTLAGSISTLKASWQNFLSGVGSTQDVLDSLKRAMNKIKETALIAIKDIGGELGKLLKKTLEPIKQWMEEHKTALTIAAGVIGTLTAAIVAYTISQNLANIALGIYNGVIGLATTLSTAFGAVMAFITSPVTLVVLAIGALITAIVLLVQNWETVKQKTLEVWEGIKAGVSAGVEKVKGFFSNLGAKISEKVDNIKTKLGEFGSKMKEVATTKIPQAINNISTFFSQLPAKLWSHLTNAISKFQNFCINLANKAKEGAKKAVNAIKNGFANLPQNMVNIGKNIVQGIWNGIGNMANWLFEKIKSFKDAVLNKFKSFFGIHSPSTLFRDEIGDNLALGIGEGFNDSIGAVYKKMRSAVDFETQKLSANLSTTANVNRLLTAYIDVNGDINMDSEKVGRMTAPTVARTFRTAGAY